MLQIIWHSITRRWVQSLSTLLAVSVSVGILFALYLLYFGVSQGVETGKKRLGADLLVVSADAKVEAESALFTGAPLNIYMEKSYEEKIAGIPGISRLTSHFFTQTLIRIAAHWPKPHVSSVLTRLQTGWSIPCWGMCREAPCHPMRS